MTAKPDQATMAVEICVRRFGPPGAMAAQTARAARLRRLRPATSLRGFRSNPPTRSSCPANGGESERRRGARPPLSSYVGLMAPVSRDNLGFLLAKASHRWNEQLAARFRAAGFAEVRPSYGSVLVPLFEEDSLRMGELARRARLSKQTMTTLVRSLERDGLDRRTRDRYDGRAFRISLTDRANEFRPVAEAALTDLDRTIRERLSRTEVEFLRDTLRKVMQL